MKILGLDKVKAQFEKMRKKVPQGGKVSYIVGYTQNHALYVHEDLQASHSVGQAKYLEGPARESQRELANIGSNAMKQGVALDQAVMLMALELQRRSQQAVPVDTGALKNSAFTRKDK